MHREMRARGALAPLSRGGPAGVGLAFLGLALVGLSLLGCEHDASVDGPRDAADGAVDSGGSDGARDSDAAVEPLLSEDAPFVREPFPSLPQWDMEYPFACRLPHAAACNAQLFTGGVAVRDLDEDGRPDLYLTYYDAPDRVFLRTDDGWEEAVLPGLEASSLSNGAAFGDIDNDGDPDLLVGTVGEHEFRLFINRGGTFDERAVPRGAAQRSETIHAAMSLCFGDYDLDGFLDMHTTEWRAPIRSVNRSHNALLRNRGRQAPGFFDDRTADYGVDVLNVARGGAWGFTSHFADLDGDRFPELVVTADYGSSRLFWSEDGVGFVDGTVASGVGTDENGMGSALGDYDGDGDLDLFVSSIFDNDCPEGDQCFWGTTGNRLFRNEGNRRFVDVTEAQGLLDGGWAWGTRFFDYDLDGDLDLIQVNGTRGAWPETGFDNENLRLFRNDGDRFSEVALELGLIDRGIGRAVVPFDADRDGDLDLLITHNMGSPHFWRNEAAEGRSWLRVKPQGTISNRDGMGAVVRVWTRAGAPPMVRHAGNGCGFLGQSEGTPHFGLGDVERVHRVEVYWPATDQRQAFENVDARQELLVIEPRL